MTLIQEACECDNLRAKIRERVEFCRVCGDDALREMAGLQSRITELERERDDIYSAFVGRDGMHMPLKEALEERFKELWARVGELEQKSKTDHEQWDIYAAEWQAEDNRLNKRVAELESQAEAKGICEICESVSVKRADQALADSRQLAEAVIDSHREHARLYNCQCPACQTARRVLG